MQSTAAASSPATYRPTYDTASTSKLPQLTLKCVASSTSGYVFPPIYSFHAFFTRQPRASTFASQSRQWISLILSFCAHHRIFRLELSESALLRDSADDPTRELWYNKRIERRAKPDFIQELIFLMVKAGSASYDPSLPSSSSSTLAAATRLTGSSSSLPANPPTLPPGQGALIFWKTPEEWGQLIYQWIVDTGQNNSIMTMYELSEPGSTKDFVDLPPQLLKMALQTLVKQGKAQLLQVSDGEGVKFL